MWMRKFIHNHILHHVICVVILYQLVSSQEGVRSTRPLYQCATSSRACQNFHEDVLLKLNVQIKLEYEASYVYQAMANYFNRADVELRGFGKFFQKLANEEREHALKLTRHINDRGGVVQLADIPKPQTDEWKSGLDALHDSLKLEHQISRHLLDLHWDAQVKNDANLLNILEGDFLTEQMESISFLSRQIAVLQRVKESPVGEFLFDQELYKEKR